MDNKILMSRACAGFLSIFVEGTFGVINPSKTHENVSYKPMGGNFMISKTVGWGKPSVISYR